MICKQQSSYAGRSSVDYFSATRLPNNTFCSEHVLFKSGEQSMLERRCHAVQALCVNDSVLQLGSAAQINERCLELQSAKARKQAANGDEAGAVVNKKSSSKAQCGCPFRKPNRTSERHLKAVLTLLCRAANAVQLRLIPIIPAQLPSATCSA